MGLGLDVGGFLVVLERRERNTYSSLAYTIPPLFWFLEREFLANVFFGLGIFLLKLDFCAVVWWLCL